MQQRITVVEAACNERWPGCRRQTKGKTFA